MESSPITASAPSLGLMKGVMLCNRPVAHETASLMPMHSSFKTGIPSERVHPTGRDPILEFREAEEFKRQATILERHKAWLHSLTQQREALVRVAEEQKRRREAKSQKLAEQSKAFRDLVRAQPSPRGDEVPHRAALPDTKDRLSDSTGHAVNKSEHKQESPPRKQHQKQNSKAKKKPAWAASEAAHEAAEEDEAEDLMDFAQGLDFDGFLETMEEKVEDKYYNDKVAEIEALKSKAEAEVKAMESASTVLRKKKKKRSHKKTNTMSAILSAIAADSGAAPVAANRASDTTQPSGVPEVDSHPRAIDAAEADKSDLDEDSDEDGDTVGSSVDFSDGDDGDTLGTLNSISSKRPVRVRAGDDSGSIATSILSSASSIRSVHSKQSLTKLIDRHLNREKARIAAAVAAGNTDDHATPVPATTTVVPAGIVAPKIVVSTEISDAHDDKKHLVSLLPFQRRNPAA